MEKFMSDARSTILIVGHGSRVERANQEFELLVDKIRLCYPRETVTHGYIELVKPDFQEALFAAAEMSDQVMVAPLFLFAASHVKTDIPFAVDVARRRFPAVRLTVARPLGVHPQMAALVDKRVKEKAACMGKSPEKIAVMVIGRGASDPDANGDFCKLVRLVEETRDYGRVVCAFVALAHPDIETALERLVKESPQVIIFQPYLFFAGRLVQQLERLIEKYQQRYSWIKMIVAEPLGDDALTLDLLRERIQDARVNDKPLACDNCQYRIPINGVEEKVGGLNALLWSVRHRLTHNQAMPHAHAAIKKHVLICGNVDCVKQGSVQVIEELRRLIKDHGLQKDIRVTQTSCLGCCGDGPMAVIYPDGIWYRRCEPKFTQDIFEKHLRKDELVPEIVDQIMM
jgi:sirohydrochlorin ferrochelatase/(2Fe-2S) ferredoxin